MIYQLYAINIIHIIIITAYHFSCQSGKLISGNDYYVYYIDCTDLSDYLDMVEEFYNDRDTIKPGELISMLGSQYRAVLRQHWWKPW